MRVAVDVLPEARRSCYTATGEFKRGLLGLNGTGEFSAQPRDDSFKAKDCLKVKRFLRAPRPLQPKNRGDPFPEKAPLVVSHWSVHAVRGRRARSPRCSGDMMQAYQGNPERLRGLVRA
jgi:hypothetical protein